MSRTCYSTGRIIGYDGSFKRELCAAMVTEMYVYNLDLFYDSIKA